MPLAKPEVMDEVRAPIPQLLAEETVAPPRPPAQGDITKEALTGSRDAAKQTAGPRRAWEKRHYGPTVN